MTTIDWDAAAGSFDEEPDHGLLDPAVRDAWAGRLAGWLPGTRADVLDLDGGSVDGSRVRALRGGITSAPGPSTAPAPVPSTT